MNGEVELRALGILQSILNGGEGREHGGGEENDGKEIEVARGGEGVVAPEEGSR